MDLGRPSDIARLLVRKRVRVGHRPKQVGVWQAGQQLRQIVARGLQSGGQGRPVPEVLGHDQLALQPCGRHALQRASCLHHVPGVAARIGDHADLGAVQRTRDQIQTLVGVSGGRRRNHPPGAQRHRGGADAEDRAGAFAKQKGAYLGYPQSAFVKECLHAFKHARSGLRVARLPAGWLAFARRPEAHLNPRRGGIDQ